MTRSLSLERKWVVDAPTEPQLARLLPSSDKDERAVRRPCLSYRPGCLDPHGVVVDLVGVVMGGDLI